MVKAAKRLKDAPKAPAIRFHLREKLDLAKIEKTAMDITFIPYHGKPKKYDDEVVRSKAKNGTTHFHARQLFHRCYTVFEHNDKKAISGLRLLYVAISLIIQNAWVYSSWSYMRERKQGVQ